MIRCFHLFKIPIIGLCVTGLLTYISYRTQTNSINTIESRVALNLLERIMFEFEWRYKQSHLPTTLEFLNCNMTRSTFSTLSSPTLEYSAGVTSVGWIPKVESYEREDFENYGNNQYPELNGSFEIKSNVDIGVVSTRYVDNSTMYPMLYNLPISTTYMGYDFYTVASHVINKAIGSKKSVSTDKIILPFFGGLSNYVYENFTPIVEVENEVSFMILHPVTNTTTGENMGIVANAFEPRGFILDIASSPSEIVKNIGVYVFRKTNFVEKEFELLFDLKGSDETNPETEITIENIPKSIQSYKYHKRIDNINLEIILILSSDTVPEYFTWLSTFITGIVSTLCIWFMYIHLRKIADSNESLSKAKTIFISEMSHELRTPLNGIMGMTDLLQDEVSSSNGIECIHDLRTCCTFLLSIISEVLDFSRIESGKIQTVVRNTQIRNNIVSIMRVLKFYQSSNERRIPLKLKLFISKDVPENLTTDVDKIGKIVMNFVGNSIKFTEKGSISVGINICYDIPQCIPQKIRNNSFLQLEDGEVEKYLHISVRDTGKGMTEDAIKNLFKPFSQVQLGRSSEGGTGLGLVICKSFSEAMGGCISCESKEGIGTTFTALVKAKTSIINRRMSEMEDYIEEWVIESSNSTENKRPSEMSNICSESDDIENGFEKYLLVDDISINLRVIGKFLEKSDIKYHTCSSGEDAMILCGKYKYVKIFMDYHMGGCTGVEAGINIRKYGINKETPIIILTASECSDEIKSLGFEYLQKPITREVMGEVILKNK